MNRLRIFRWALLVGARDFTIFWTWKGWAFGWMLRILTNVFMWILLGRLLHSPERLHYLMVGFAATAGVGTWAISSGVWDRFDGTYPLMVIAPGSIAPAVIGRMSIWMFGWMVSSAVTLAVVALVFDWTISWPEVLALFPIVVLLCGSTFCLTVFFGALAALTPRFRNIMGALLIIVIAAFCGVSVPVTFWPVWIQKVVVFLPVTHGLAAIRLVLDHGDLAEIFQEIGLESFVGFGWLAMGLLVMDRFAESGRASGSIEYQ